MKTVPPELWGEWITDEPRYENHPFVLNRESVLFGQGDGQYAAFRVESVDTTLEQEYVLYSIRYRTRSGHTFSFDFRFAPDPEPRIRFRNQPQILWQPARRDS